MMFDDLAPEEKRTVVRLAMAGSKQSAENFNRTMEQLSNNPRLADRYIQEAGIADQSHPDEVTEPVDSEAETSSDIEEAVDRAAGDSEEGINEEETPYDYTEYDKLNDPAYLASQRGHDILSNGYLKPIPGESAEEYIQRMNEHRKAPQMPGRRTATTLDEDD